MCNIKSVSGFEINKIMINVTKTFWLLIEEYNQYLSRKLNIINIINK